MSHDHYAILGVARTAPQELIRERYRRLARDHHPDLNPRDKSASARMAEINEAYRVLSDASLRRQYDEGFRAAARGTTSGETDTAPPPSPIACERCGASDTSLRVAMFTKVAGLILWVRRWGEPKVLCRKCRGVEALQANSISAALGLWAVIIGPVFVVIEGIRNAAGGRQVPELNSLLLQDLARFRRWAGDAEGAEAALMEAKGLSSSGTGRLTKSHTVFAAVIPVSALAVAVAALIALGITAGPTQAEQVDWANPVVAANNELVSISDSLPRSFPGSCAPDTVARLNAAESQMMAATQDPPDTAAARRFAASAQTLANVFVPWARSVCSALSSSSSSGWNSAVALQGNVDSAFERAFADYQAFEASQD